MSSRAGSSIGAFLVSLPVSAMLLMMLFGVPRFAPGTNGENGWDNARNFINKLRGESPDDKDGMFRDYPPQAADQSADPFARVSRGQPLQAEAPRWGDQAAIPVQPVADQSPDNRRDAGGGWPYTQAGGPAATDSRPRGESATTPVTWTEARRKLAELGVQEFHLEPGLARDQYLFVCLFTPGDDARITHRFEAEAADPLSAVQQVLTQIDAWLSQRYADRSRQIIQPFGSNPPGR